MRSKFDLWSHEDVVGNADKILDRLRAGNMPCDEARPDDRVDLFARWVESREAS
jgi:hypothetical protein